MSIQYTLTKKVREQVLAKYAENLQNELKQIKSACLKDTAIAVTGHLEEKFSLYNIPDTIVQALTQAEVLRATNKLEIYSQYSLRRPVMLFFDKRGNPIYDKKAVKDIEETIDRMKYGIADLEKRNEKLQEEARTQLEAVHKVEDVRLVRPDLYKLIPTCLK